MHHSHAAKPPKSNRLGFTLVELLVLIAVLVTVTAILIPTVRFVLGDRKIRESTRVVDSFITEAQTEAVSTGMGGIWIERDQNSPDSATRIYKIKSLPPYTGDFLGATCQINFGGRNGMEVLNGVDDGDSDNFRDNLYQAEIQFNMNTSANVINLVQAGDLIQFDFKGPWYVIGDTPTWPGGAAQLTNPVRVFSASGPIPTFLPQNGPIFVRFKIMRMPERASASYIDLPRDTMIDLSKSGLTVLDLNGNMIGDDPLSQGNEFRDNPIPPNPSSAVQIIFGKDGGIDTIIANGIAVRPDRSIHLLLAVDERENNADFGPASTQTLENLSNFWLTITRQGAVSTSPVADVTTDPTPPNLSFVGDVLRSSRRNARQIETTGGG